MFNQLKKLTSVLTYRVILKRMHIMLHIKLPLQNLRLTRVVAKYKQ